MSSHSQLNSGITVFYNVRFIKKKQKQKKKKKKNTNKKKKNKQNVVIPWIKTPLGIEWPFHSGCISDIYIMIPNSSKISYEVATKIIL